MAYAKTTLNDLLLSFSYRYGESSIPPSGTEKRVYWINRGIDYIVNRLELTKSASVIVSGNTCDLNGATGTVADFKSFIRLEDSSQNTYTLVNPADYEASEGTVCAITGDHSSGYTLKVKYDGTYTLYYSFHFSPLVNLTDECIVYDPEAVVAYAYAQMRLSETDPLQDASRNLEECEARIRMMSSDINRNEGDLRFKSLY